MKTLGLFLLLAAAAAAQQPKAAPAAGSGNTACLRCHESVATLLKSKVVHAAVELGCDSCHVNHDVDASAKGKAGYYLVSRQPDLCTTCHSTKDAALVAAHRGQPFERANCSGCHNPHASDNAKLISGRAHPPFAERQCQKCHVEPEGGKVKFVAASVNELCEGCHTEFKARYDQSKVKHTLVEIDKNSCIDCHRPHASAQPKLLKAAVNTVCTGCHVDKPGNKKFIHEPAMANCAICHDPHSSNFHVHLKADVNTLCTACHGLHPPAQNSEGTALTVPENFRQMATKISLDSQNRGHPYIGHPVSGPGIAPQQDKTLSCVSCHTPHSGTMVQRFVGELRGNALCLSCHGKK